MKVFRKLLVPKVFFATPTPRLHFDESMEDERSSGKLTLSSDAL